MNVYAVFQFFSGGTFKDRSGFVSEEKIAGGEFCVFVQGGYAVCGTYVLLVCIIGIDVIVPFQILDQLSQSSFPGGIQIFYDCDVRILKILRFG